MITNNGRLCTGSGNNFFHFDLTTGAYLSNYTTEANVHNIKYLSTFNKFIYVGDITTIYLYSCNKIMTTCTNQANLYVNFD